MVWAAGRFARGNFGPGDKSFRRVCDETSKRGACGLGAQNWCQRRQEQ